MMTMPHNDRLDEILERLRRLDDHLTGGPNQERGMIVRLFRLEDAVQALRGDLKDRDEQAADDRKARRTTLYGALGSALVATLAAVLSWVRGH